MNIASLYSELGQLDAAVASIEQALAGVAGRQAGPYLPKLQIQLAILRARQGRLAEAVDWFGRGIESADRAGDWDLYAQGWSRLGEEYLLRNELSAAEGALLEAFRVRKLHKLPNLEASYRSLGRLRLAQGDLRSAAVLLDQALACSRSRPGRLSAWEIYFARGRVRLAQARYGEALSDLRIAVEGLRLWRRAAPPADAMRVSTEGLLDQVYAARIEAAARLYFETGNASLARESFAAAEENRAASLRAALAEPREWRRALPAGYWETLARLDAAEAELVRRPAPQIRDEIRSLRTALLQMESRAGSVPFMETPDLLRRTQEALDPDTVYLGFHLGETASYLWAVAPGAFSLSRLPARAELERAAARFSRAVHAASPAADALGERVARLLFGALGPRFDRKQRWCLALDAELFELPFAALVVGHESGRPVYLVERHALQITSGAALLVARAPRREDPWTGPFVGVGDAIYNAADPRWRSAGGARPSLALARLPGSAREVETCARAWPCPATLLEGAEASKNGLSAALQRRPGVLHMATHVVESGATPRTGLIVLSLTPGGRHEVLTPAEIATWQIGGALVTLTGCSSGSGQSFPGTGLMGLTRAWLAAGARGVIASHWPTPDDSGAFFGPIYRYLQENPTRNVALALRSAQTEVLRSRSWRSSPTYWSSYFVVANQ